MADKMINETSPTPKKGVDGIGDTAKVHYEQWDMNYMNNPIEKAKENIPSDYTIGQSKQK
jgi:hypothetical protein